MKAADVIRILKEERMKHARQKMIEERNYNLQISYNKACGRRTTGMFKTKGKRRG